MKVKVFSMEGCSGCVVVKNTLNQKGIPFEEIDIFEREDLASQYRVRTLPTTVVVGADGTEHIITGSATPAIQSIILHALEV